MVVVAVVDLTHGLLDADVGVHPHPHAVVVALAVRERPRWEREDEKRREDSALEAQDKVLHRCNTVTVQ